MNITLANNRKATLLLFDLFAITFIYFVPAISHVLNVPLYLLEPMRIILILAMVHTHKMNAYVLAATLPFFTFLVSGHPLLPKAIVISGELVLNVFLFFTLLRVFKAKFPAIVSSIILSKMVYYLLKFALIQTAVLEMGLISTPIWIQVAMVLVLSGYVALFLRKNATK
ncbi:MAG: hypothetical protein K9I74_14390 [Bacteroidales bacterium]|nr:hypothetical protein [Bacteroidales bacterium]